MSAGKDKPTGPSHAREGSVKAKPKAKSKPKPKPISENPAAALGLLRRARSRG